RKNSGRRAKTNLCSSHLVWIFPHHNVYLNMLLAFSKVKKGPKNKGSSKETSTKAITKSS
ncbi:hypothetical protein GCK32_019182, partial [Trichostrongylus colubriformis]